jgi:hypothetical protein
MWVTVSYWSSTSFISSSPSAGNLVSLIAPPIDLAALLGHRLDRQKLMSSREELAEKLLRILIRLSHDPLLQQADLAGDLGNHFSFPACDRGDDRIGKPDGEVGCSRPLSIRAATASVSHSAASNGTFGFSGPCT